MRQQRRDLMKTIKWLGLVTALVLSLCPSRAQETSNMPEQAQAPSVPDNISPGVAEVMRLAEAGAGEDVVLAYIENAGSSFNLTVDQILYLKDNGVSSA